MKNSLTLPHLGAMKFFPNLPVPPKIREGLGYFLFGGLGLTLFFGMFGGIKTLSDLLQSILLNGITFLVFGMVNSLANDFLDRFLSWTNEPSKRFVVSIITTMLVTSFAWVFIVYLYIIPESGFVSFDIWMKAVSKSLSSLRFTMLITFAVSSFIHGRTFLKQWQNALLEAEQLKRAQMSAQYETLKTQVNPHFLFNSLNVLSNLVHKDADLSEQFIQQLSKVYRYVLESRDQDTVPLSEEWRNLESYIFLMKIRFGESLLFEENLSQNTEGVQVAPLTLQMLVENALKHNEVSKAHPLSISVFSEGDFLVVKNKLQLKSKVIDSTGIGLENIRARYRILAGKEVVVLEEDGFFTVKIPKI